MDMLKQPGGPGRAGSSTSSGGRGAVATMPGMLPTLPSPAPTARTPLYPPPNDCEIMVMSKAHQKYAERVEKALRDIGLRVDLMFPKPDILVQAFVAHIADTGATFAVVIRADNETHQSLSVHVLKPKAEEHRNMPLQTAIKFMKDRHRLVREAEFSTVCPEFLELVKRMANTIYIPDADYLQMTRYLMQRWETQKLLENRKEYDTGLGINSVPQIQKKIIRALGLEQMET